MHHERAATMHPRFSPNTVGPTAELLRNKVSAAIREKDELLARNIADLQPKELVQYLERLETKYGLSPDGDFPKMDLGKFADNLFTVFSVPKDGEFATEMLVKVMKVPIKEAVELTSSMMAAGLHEDVATSARITNLLDFLYNANHYMHTLHRSFCISRDASKLIPIDTRNQSVVPGLTQFRAIQPDETNDFQKLVLHLLFKAKELKYRKYNGDCYVQRYNAQNQYTHAWQRECSIKDFIYDNTTKTMNFNEWKFLTQNRSNASAAADYLANCKEPEFPDLVKDRHVFSFRNGVYIARHWDGTKFIDVFWPFERATQLPSHLVACKYFDIDFDAHEDARDWRDIPTPHLKSIMDFQEWTEDVQDWMYVFIGRLLYQVGEMDCWQVIPFLKGTAGSGKSTIALKVCGNLFEKTDVGILSNNIEKKFGIHAFCDKYLFVAPEIKSDLQMEQAEFQSMVSGEDIQINVKFQKAQSVEWKVPGIMAGNELPNWGDNSGSFSRRTIIFEFPKQVRNGDMELARKLETEMAALILKCNKAYLEATAKYAKDNIWNHLPGYFRDNRSEMEQATNSVEHFLNSGKLKFSKDAYVRYDEFVQFYKGHVRDFNFPTKKINKDLWNTPFLNRGLRVSFELRDGVKTYWVIGADFAEKRGFGDY